MTVIVLAVLAASCHTISVSDPWAPGGILRPYYCDPTDTAINDGHGDHHGGEMTPFMMAYTEEKGPLSSADCQSVATDIQAAVNFVSQFPTVADAEAAGWEQAAIWSAGQGIHYVDPARITGPLDLQTPNWLMYDGNASDSQLTGMMFLLDTGTTMPPAGFAGDNDHWHQHGALCTDTSPGAYPFVIGEHMTDAECTAIGGVNITHTTIWMVHVWLPVYDGWVPTDVFNKSHPNVPDVPPVELTQQTTAAALGATWELDFYRNNTYECGLSGNYTFLVMNPADNPTAEAPLWVYLHGGGVGYYDQQGIYHAVKNQTEDTYNHEETFTDLWDDQVVFHTLDNTGQPIDSTLKRRIEEGYRVLVVSMCDHDLYSGQGTPYTNHPTNPDAEVNGLEATMAAIGYTAANYPTTHVFAHGTSAGSLGAWSLASTYASQGNPLTGIVADSWITTPRILITAAAFSGQPGYPFGSDFDLQGVTDKVGYFADPDIPTWPEAEIGNDWRGVPSLFINGNDDPFCGGNQTLLPEADAAGLTNCQWLHDALRQAIDDQPNSPHEFHNLLGYGHVPTNAAGPVNDIVDTFIADVLATNPPHPFG